MATIVSIAVNRFKAVINDFFLRAAAGNRSSFRTEQTEKRDRGGYRESAAEMFRSLTGVRGNHGGEHYIGKNLFATLAIEHEGAPDFPRITRDSFANFVIDDTRLVLSRAAVEPFQTGEGVVAVDGEFYGLPATVPQNEPKPQLTVETDYQGLDRELLTLEEEYMPPTLEVSARDDRIMVSWDGGETEIEPGQERRIRVGEREVAVPTKDGSTEQAQVTPVVKVYNHGHLAIYGSSDETVLPLRSDSTYVQNRVRSIQANSSERAERDEEDDLLIVSEGGE